MKTKIISLTVMLFVGMLMAISSPVPGSAQAPSKSYTIYFVEPMSGPAAKWGVATVRGMEMWVEDVNAKGGLNVGGERYKLLTKTYDTAYSPPEALTAIRKAAADGAKYVHTIGAGPLPAMLPVINEKKIICFGSIALGKELTNPQNPTVYRWMPGSFTNYSKMGKLIYAGLQSKRIATIFPNDELGRREAVVIKDVIKEAKIGAEVVASELYERGTVDFTPILTRVLVQKPDMIETDSAHPETLAVIMKQAAEFGYKGWHSNVAGTVALDALVKITGLETASRLIVIRSWDRDVPPSKEYVKFLDDYQKRWGEEPFGGIGETYAGWQFWKACIEKAGTFDVDKFMTTAKGLKVDTLVGSWKYIDPYDYGIEREADYPLPISKVVNGKIKLWMWAK